MATPDRSTYIVARNTTVSTVATGGTVATTVATTVCIRGTQKLFRLDTRLMVKPTVMALGITQAGTDVQTPALSMVCAGQLNSAL